RNSLNAALAEDHRNLISLQEESYRRMEQQHADERKLLERNIEERLRKLNQQVLSCLLTIEKHYDDNISFIEFVKIISY
ncbi:unnamed protein product, partial [Rotaria magnacalcarata]